MLGLNSTFSFRLSFFRMDYIYWFFSWQPYRIFEDQFENFLILTMASIGRQKPAILSVICTKTTPLTYFMH